ncbi:MAG: YhdP family protein [Halioglobus sp.]
MQHSFFSRLGRVLWAILVLLVVLLAIYVSLGRLFMANLNAYREPLLQELNARLPFAVSAQEMSGVWRSFSPEIVLDQLSVSVPGGSAAPVQLASGEISLNLLQSLRTRSLALNHLTLHGLELRAQLTSDGKLSLKGFESGGGQSGDWLAEFIRNVEQISLLENSVRLLLPSGEERVMDLDLELVRNGIHRRLQGTLSSTAGTQILILANGVGDPQQPETLTGSAYLQIEAAQLEAMRALMGPGAPPVWSKGSADVEVWLTLEEGKPSIEARMSARDLVVYSDDGKLELPLESVALQGQVQREKENWTLYGSQMEVRQGDTRLTLPRLQADLWGSAARVRIEDVPLEPVGSIAASVTVIPESLREILATLSPSGTLPSVQINVGDIGSPTQDWELDASFKQLAVESFKGAPGVNAASGYAQLKPGGGSVVLDSQSLALAFPSIYHEPLAFDDVFGTLNIFWDKELVQLSSGLITAFGEEGTARVLFGLDVPLKKTEPGVEMQLLVGLENTDTQFRDKYIPYTLSSGLRSWLADSIRAGTIEQGAFLWRGSLRKEAPSLRTVQLAFNVSDAQLNYHPEWPEVFIGAGQVLIDDAAVSVWSEDAALYNSGIKNMSVELRVDEAKELQLAIDGQLRGPAADGFRIINESALSNLVGNTFSKWRAKGQLEADLSVELNLTNKKATPHVDVTTRWDAVALTIAPGNLQVDQLQGDVTYASSSGFSSKSLVGELWGSPVDVQLTQRHANPERGYDPKKTVLEVGARSRVKASSVQDWLSLDLLAMAEGEADMDLRLAITPGSKPQLRVTSDLEGIAIDMPQPYGKVSQERRELDVGVKLGEDQLPISLRLGGGLALDMEIQNGQLAAASLGVLESPLVLQPGRFQISGAPPYVDGDAWLAFLNEYFALGGVLEPASLPTVDATSLEDAVENKAAGNIALSIDRLSTPLLTLWDRELKDVELSLASNPDGWKLDARSDRVIGYAQLARPPLASKVFIEYVDVDALFATSASAVAAKKQAGDTQPAIAGSDVIVVPPLDFEVENLFRSEQRYGSVGFALRSIGSVLKLGDIVGELGGLKLQSDSPGQLLWRQGEEQNTHIEGLVEFADLGESLEQLGYQRILKTQGGALDAKLQWPGTPAEFALAAAEGSILVDFDSGNFLDAPSGAAGALRVVNVLNLADIVRRLSLTHMFETGIAFDGVTGEVYLHGGSIEVARMAVKGPSSFQFSGISDVAQRSLNGELVATLPVANNLPWVAALAASLPVAAGVFVVSKVFDKQMSRLSSAVYAVEGTWDEPRIEFDRIFDDTAKAVELPAEDEELESEETSSTAEP